MKKYLKTILVVALAAIMVFGLVACGTKKDSKKSDETKVAGFVTFGLGGDFFQMLADQFVTTFKAAGWDAKYEDGQFNPEAQIAAAENYIAQGVDALIIWSVAPEAMGAVVEDAMAKGIKVISFVARTENYDALMVADDATLADYLCKVAAKWLDEHYKDAPDHSVPVAVFTERDADTGVLQADELLKMADYSKKVGEVKEIACTAESAEEGQAKAENLYATNPEIKVFLTAHNAIAKGINAYYTGLSSPVKDYSKMGIFCVNGDEETGKYIQGSIKNETPFRGMVMTGGVEDTANEMLDVATGVLDGTYEKGYVRMANTVFVYADTVEEYLATGNVTSVTNADFDK